MLGAARVLCGALKCNLGYLIPDEQKHAHFLLFSCFSCMFHAEES